MGGCSQDDHGGVSGDAGTGGIDGEDAVFELDVVGLSGECFFGGEGHADLVPVGETAHGGLVAAVDEIGSHGSAAVPGRGLPVEGHRAGRLHDGGEAAGHAGFLRLVRLGGGPPADVFEDVLVILVVHLALEELPLHFPLQRVERGVLRLGGVAGVGVVAVLDELGVPEVFYGLLQPGGVAVGEFGMVVLVSVDHRGGQSDDVVFGAWELGHVRAPRRRCCWACFPRFR